MKNGSTLFLKISVFLIGTPVLAVCLFLLPQLAVKATEEAQKGSELAYVVFGILIIVYASTIPFYVVLHQAIKLLQYIDKNKAFSELSVKSLTRIKKCALTISGLYMLALPLVFIIAEWDDAPGLVLVGMVFVGASFIIAVFAAVLQRLLKDAIDLKSENDLTV